MKALIKFVVFGFIAMLILGFGLKLQQKFMGNKMGNSRPAVKITTITQSLANGKTVDEVIDNFALSKKAWRFVSEDLRKQRRYTNSSSINTVKVAVLKKPILCDSCKAAGEKEGHCGYSQVNYNEKMGTNAFGATVMNRVKTLVYFDNKGNVVHAEESAREPYFEK